MFIEILKEQDDKHKHCLKVYIDFVEICICIYLYNELKL